MADAANRPMDTRKPPTGVGTADGFQELVVRLCVTARPGHSRPSSRSPSRPPQGIPHPVPPLKGSSKEATVEQQYYTHGTAAERWDRAQMFFDAKEYAHAARIL